MPSIQIPLTETKVCDELLKPRPDRQWYYDTKSPVKLLVGKSGSGTYYVKQSLKGEKQPTTCKLGRAGRQGIRLLDAVADAKEKVALLARGINPNEQLKEARVEIENDRKLNIAWAEYIIHCRKIVDGEPRHRSWKFKDDNYQRHTAPALGNKRLSKITEAEVQKLYDGIVATSPRMANVVTENLHSMYNHFKLPSPVAIKDKVATRKRKRVLSEKEARRLLDAVKDERDNVQHIIKLCLFTTARSGNVKGMRWQDLDLDAGIWRLPKKIYKTKVDEEIALAGVAVEVIRSRKRGESEYVFPSPRASKAGYVTNIRREFDRVKEKAGLGADVTMHTLRHTGITLVVDDHGIAVGQKQAGHASPKQTAQYTHLGASDIRDRVDSTMLKLTRPEGPTVADLEQQLVQIQQQLAAMKQSEEVA